MQIRQITVRTETGLGPIDLAFLIQSANTFKSLIKLEHQGKSANAKSLLSVMAFEIRPGIQIRITADGQDEEEAVDALAALLEAPDVKEE